MKFLVHEVLSGSSFEIEVDYKDTLLEVKQKIEKSQRIPVSKQTLLVDGIVILREDLTVKQCQIVHDSLLQLHVSSDKNPNHNGDDNQMPQTEPSPAPWIPVEEYFERQGWPLTSEEIKKIYSYRSETTQEMSKIQDSPVTVVSSNKNQMLHQTKQSPLSNSVKETVNIQDSYVKVVSKNNNNNNSGHEVPPTKQSLQSKSVKEITTKIQNPPAKVMKRVPKERMVVFVSLYPGEYKPGIVANVNPTDAVKKLREEIVQRGDIQKLPLDEYFFTHKKQVLNEDQSYEWNGVKDADTIVMVPRYVIQQTSKIQDLHVTFGSSRNKNQVFHQTKQSPQSYSTKHINNSSQDSTVRVQLPQTKQSPAAAYSNVPKRKIKVFVLPSSDECKGAKNKIEVDVNLTDHVKILRNVLAESQRRGDLNLPQQGYYFEREQKVMNEDESFAWNGFTGPTDVVWMVPRRVTMQ
ncbi:PREDICTED: uncharacterized protein LOC104707699 [Camelina sativa]|uniref:Uncharacterized protein LOC104707699 n=1 Tax=Camelina sativa TaxID=90675 RepID=A0ABM0T8C1_CAMSA|nr:PREDICTED: uncharacterized protein LOC104707699 [Camelina sativa]